MSLIDLPTAKAHLRLDADYPDEQVAPYLDAAVVASTDFLNRRVYATEDELSTAIAAVPTQLAAASTAYDSAMEAAANIDHVARTAAEEHAERVLARAKTAARETYDGMVLNAPIRAAVLLALGHLFENRQDDVSAADLPAGARSLLMPHRVGWGA